jgi:hypothetical protein
MDEGLNVLTVGDLLSTLASGVGVHSTAKLLLLSSIRVLRQIVAPVANAAMATGNAVDKKWCLQNH